ncbi:MAG: PEGA domain-containing protein [Phycisphaerae bacterium]|nr:MAG: PEGA domain-containing protein [Planctomycetota bacterium]MBE7458274.1 PEGA domain-containing protein [Planctomycetia bacterium]MCK6466089.1 PEGA domain-containing protein [Phycisphaerae bacterium]MCL4718690.1 PEGA domain-containing protein [Phycisphaerae bacterium]NUQ10076.1 PEGA domain-containing protein [Phycisphaerae bacterium]
MIRHVLYVLMVIFMVPLTGCATIVHGNDQKITVTSTPPGAQVLHNGAVKGVTPCDVELSRRPFKSVLTVRKDGCSDKEIVVKNGVSMWALLGNFIFGGIPGWIIDAATGSFGAYYQDHYDVQLEARAAG